MNLGVLQPHELPGSQVKAPAPASNSGDIMSLIENLSTQEMIALACGGAGFLLFIVVIIVIVIRFKKKQQQKKLKNKGMGPIINSLINLIVRRKVILVMIREITWNQSLFYVPNGSDTSLKSFS